MTEEGSSREPVVINGDDEILLYVRDRRKPTQFSIDNAVMDEWLPIIDTTGYAIYSLLIRMANENSGESCYPGYTMIQEHLGISRSTISVYVTLLEWCQLIYRDRPEVVIVQNGRKKKRRLGNRSNTYYILDVAPLTKERLKRIRALVEESASKDGTGLTSDYRTKFLRAIDSWKPLQFHWAARKRKKIKTIVGQPSLFESENEETLPDSPPPDHSIFSIKTNQMYSDFGLVGKPAKELAGVDEPLVLAWIWQCQIEGMGEDKAPGYIVKRLRENDSPGEDKYQMAYAWLTMKAADREELRDAAEHMRLRGYKTLADGLDENFLPDLTAEALSFYEKAYKVGALYTDI